jgi:hypothetical protein
MIIAAGLLDGHAYFLHWGVIQISLANLLVIVAMVVVFVLALIVPFPHARHGGADDAVKDDFDVRH